MSEIKIHSSWKPYLEQEFAKPYMQSLKQFLLAEQKNGKTIYPLGKNYFAAFDLCPFEKVKVVVLGQDPYHGPGQAHGLSFSVPKGVPFPPSLRNIFKELAGDLGVQIPSHGCLQSWAEQGVLLLNSVLTVEDGKAASHQGKGWEQFTDHVIRMINDNKQNVVFILWGSYAQKKAAFVDRNKHLVIESPHPSPLSAHRGFFGTKPFSKINNYLSAHRLKQINWSSLNEDKI